MTDQDEAARVAAHFRRADGRYLFARWGRPIAPAVFGSDETGAEIFGAALTSVAGLAGLDVTQSDPELGSNFLVFFCSDWSELAATPHLDRMIPDLEGLADRLNAAKANQYRIFGFEPDAEGRPGAIRVCAVLLRYDADLRKVSARTLAVSQAAQSLLLWSDSAFRDEGPVAVVAETGRAVVKPWHADLIRAAYDPVLPARADDASHALRVAARMAAARG